MGVLQTNLPHSLMAVPLASLRLNSVPGFNIYLKPGSASAPVLYRGADLPFTEETRQRLVEHAVQEVYIASNDEAVYLRYLEENLGPILADETISIEHRSSMLYHSATNVIKELLADPRAGDLLSRSNALVEHTTQLMRHQNQALRSLMRVSSYDYYTYTHSVNVFVFSLSLAQRLGFGGEELQRFGQGALLHDVGKSRLNAEIVNSRGRLTEDQWVQMRLHPVYGCEILEEQGCTDEIILDVTRHHHEKLTGKGYPDGLAGKEISCWARICTIADIFDALTTRRSYKTALNSFPSLRLMHEEMADELDQGYFRIFVEMLGAASSS
ncbi:MAG: HD domain-containing protein [Candidatus Hydrogenedentes bacterium]|nr:HD domain-containing protein [Candidatus Hydrogenedentota bacterium]